MTTTTEACKVMPCTCKHEFQDAHYGKGLRLHNRCRPKDGERWYRCTVCGAERPAKGAR